MATGIQRKKKQEKIQNTKIDSYFKPAPKSNVSYKSTPSIKRPLENDENTHPNDENRNKSLTPSNSQPMKRQFGEIKGGLQPRSYQDVFRLPLRDTDPNSSPSVSNNSKSATTICPSQKKSAPGFAVLCDEDIEKGIEKAPTPPMRDSQESLADSQDIQDIRNAQGNYSQITINSQEHELNTQCIQEGGELNTQWTEVTSSPIDVYRDSEAESPQEMPLFVFQVDNEPVLIQDHQNKERRADMDKQVGGKENQIDTTNENSQAAADDDFFKLTPTQNAEEKEEEEEDDDDDADEGDNSDLFVKTVDTSLFFKPVPLASSSAGFDYSDHEDEDESTTFFDQESEDDDGPFVDAGLEFSIDEFGINPEEESLTEPLVGSYTLSQNPAESIRQVHVPLPNPRDKDILEKLGIEKKNSTIDCKNKDDEGGLPVS